MTNSNDLKDFQRELAEKEAILKMPMNSLSRSALQNVKQSNISKKIEDRYMNMGFTEFINAMGKKL